MIEFKNVSKIYDTGNKAVQDINLSIDDGEFVFITGRSGAGKSTLLKLLTREIKASDGEVLVNGRNLGKLKNREIPRYRRNLGIIFQDFRLLNDRNVFENIAFAQRVVGASSGEIKRNVPEMMKLTGISAKYKNMPNQLSGGEQQRVAIARALINRPSVILADEPTGNLDERNSKEILNLLLDINKMGTTVIVITHSKQLVESVDKRIIIMDKGRVADDYVSMKNSGPLRGFFEEPAQKKQHGRSRKNPDFIAASDTKISDKAKSDSAAGYNEDTDKTEELPWDEGGRD